MIKRYFKSLCLFLFFVPLQLQAQIKPFEDYSKCMAGFLKVGGDTLYPAQFEEVQPVYGFRPEAKGKAWIVDFSGRKGCIDETGKWIFECEYTDLSFDYSNHLFFVKKDNQSGVFNENGEVVLPCKFNKLYLQKTGCLNYFETAHDDVDCAYDIRGKALTPECNYFRTHFLWSIDSAGTGKNYFVYNKTENGKSFFGITDETGKNVLVPSFKNVEMFFFEGQVSEDEPIFFVINDNKEWALADKNGKKLTRFFDLDVELDPIQFIEPGSRTVTYHHALANFYEKDEEKTIILNLKTGFESGPYDEVRPFGDYFVVYQKKEALVLDKDFNILFRTSMKYKRLVSFNLEGSSLSSTDGLTSISAWIDDSRQYVGSQKAQDQCDEIIFLGTEKYESARDKKTRSYAKLTYQLVQTKTGKLVEKKYDNVKRAMSKDAVYLWAINQPDNDSIFVDIYSYDGVFQRSVSFGENQANDIKNQLSYYLYYSDYEEYDPVVWVSDDSGKYKAFGHNGASITPFAFETISKVIFSENGKWVFCEGSYEKGIYYNELHEPLFNGESVSDLKPFNDRKNYFVATDKLGYLLNEHFEIIEDSLSRFQFQYSKDVLKIPDTNFPTFEKNGFCYAFINGKLLLLDSTMFLHPQKYNQLHPSSSKLEANGKFYRPEKKPYVKGNEIIGNVILALDAGTLTVTNKLTSKIANVIENAESFHYAGEKAIFIQLTTKKQGLISFETGKWVVEPKYTEVRARQITASAKEGFWARIEGQNDGKWFSLDETGKVRTEAIFDEPVYPYAFGRDQLMPFRSYGKIGLINEDYKIIVQPTFDKTVHHTNFRVFLKDGLPYLVFNNGEKMQIKHQISDFFVNKNYLFLYNDSIEIISDLGKTLVPPMPVEKAMKSYTLVNFFINPSDKMNTLPYIFNQEVFCANDDLALRYYSNHVVMDEANNFVRQLGELGTERKRDLYYDYDGRCRIEPVWISKNICTERVYGKCFPESGGNSYNFNGGCGYRVYKIEKDTCFQLILDDLLKDDAASKQKLDDMIRAKIQEKQSFGLVCADMEGTIAEFKLDYSVDKQYLFLTNEKLRENIAFPLKNLKDILRNPEWFEN